MNFTSETLLLLRQRTMLDPISYLKVLNEREKAMDRKRILKEKEHCDIAVDFSAANQLEAELRFDKWKKQINGYWIKYHSNIDLDEFALYYLLQQKNNEKKLIFRK